MAEPGTKGRLLEAALDLFSVKGYDGTSVDEIAASIGIRGPNLYRYFSGKAALYEALGARADEAYARGMGLMSGATARIRTGKDLERFALGQIAYTLRDDRIRKMRRMLTIEQYRSPDQARKATRRQIDAMESLYADIFRHMMAAGTMKVRDPDLLALAFTAPVALLIQQSDREPDRLEEIMARAAAYVRFFIREYATDAETDEERGEAT